MSRVSRIGLGLACALLRLGVSGCGGSQAPAAGEGVSVAAAATSTLAVPASDAPPGMYQVTGLRIEVAGEMQSAPAGRLAAPLQVLVRDQHGRPVRGVPVSFAYTWRSSDGRQVVEKRQALASGGGGTAAWTIELGRGLLTGQVEARHAGGVVGEVELLGPLKSNAVPVSLTGL